MRNKLFLYLILCPIFFMLIFSSKSIFVCQNYCQADSNLIEISTFDIDIPAEIKVITNTAKIFENSDITSTVLETAHYNDEFTVLLIVGDFYKIQFGESQEGYILTAFCMDSSRTPLEVYLDTNAITTAESSLYLLSGSQFVLIDNIYLPAQTRIKLLNGFNETSQYTKASISLNGEVFTYYVPTANIDPDGISTRTIVALMLIVTSVTIFLILYSFFKGKKVN